MSYAISTIRGNLGADPDLKNTPNGVQYCNFSVATTKNKKGRDGQWAPHTTWWRCTAYGQQAVTIAEKFRKGEPILVTGETSTADFIGQDGLSRTTLELEVKSWGFAGGKRDGNESGSRSQQSASPAGDGYDDIPF